MECQQPRVVGGGTPRPSAACTSHEPIAPHKASASGRCHTPAVRYAQQEAGMASVKRRRTTTGEWRYDVRYRIPSGPERSRTFRTRADATRFAHTVEADKLRGSWVDPRRSATTF